MAQKEININEIMNDDLFIKNVKKNINLLVRKRLERKPPKKGFKYKRDWYDRMDDLSPEFFLSNIIDVWNKKSNLNAESSKIILAICNQSLQETIFQQSKKNGKPEA